MPVSRALVLDPSPVRLAILVALCVEGLIHIYQAVVVLLHLEEHFLSINIGPLAAPALHSLSSFSAALHTARFVIAARALTLFSLAHIDWLEYVAYLLIVAKDYVHVRMEVLAHFDQLVGHEHVQSREKGATRREHVSEGNLEIAVPVAPRQVAAPQLDGSIQGHPADRCQEVQEFHECNHQRQK